jgi:hypothetical protein
MKSITWMKTKVVEADLADLTIAAPTKKVVAKKK